MRLESILTIALLFGLLLHLLALIMVWRERWPWSRKLLWTGIVCCVLVVGPLYYLLFKNVIYDDDSDRPDSDEPDHS